MVLMSAPCPKAPVTKAKQRQKRERTERLDLEAYFEIPGHITDQYESDDDRASKRRCQEILKTADIYITPQSPETELHCNEALSPPE